MNNIQQEKSKLRKEISSIKKGYSSNELYNRSNEVLSVLELTGVFQDAKNVFIYNNFDDEVQTLEFISKWSSEKNFYLPVVESDNLVFRPYAETTGFLQSSFGIMEPIGDNFTDYRLVDLIIIPGVAFDRYMNRLGRGKGYYDRFLTKLKAPKLGICFDFQLLDKIPVEANDVKMDYIVSENELIW
ncbi:5-formyltetrahydrofolate cyclo-ligase [Dysgonomonas sp. Marseille-P4677]|uniref:5-formyltetrahydrofolate cyclo-ligase n=1 Tax=Dysgonomonas sp. Marseille-P4677 TaxID=2364790 RepID=UPI00191199D2|nr:5-formyltetrahydrofolate cyclo-ligase [Dysgonomonas sp. Marseille-P4677]MBK5720518.1 5-formyltetrahydrofolate cyclo-ligase [Dysgonomonas sp. Marseille-P4677]